MENIIKHYSNGEIKINWEPNKCIHSGICAKGLHSVFKPKERPWIQMQNSDSETIKKQIDQCPSGALSYESENSNPPSTSNDSVVISVVENGPLLVKGGFVLQNADGSSEQINSNTALCRCGASQNKPFCDGSHKKIDFKG